MTLDDNKFSDPNHEMTNEDHMALVDEIIEDNLGYIVHHLKVKEIIKTLMAGVVDAQKSYLEDKLYHRPADKEEVQALRRDLVIKTVTNLLEMEGEAVIEAVLDRIYGWYYVPPSVRPQLWCGLSEEDARAAREMGALADARTARETLAKAVKAANEAETPGIS